MSLWLRLEALLQKKRSMERYHTDVADEDDVQMLARISLLGLLLLVFSLNTLKFLLEVGLANLRALIVASRVR